MEATGLQLAGVPFAPRANTERLSFIPCDPHWAARSWRGLLKDVVTASPLVVADLAAAMASLTVAWQVVTMLWPTAGLDPVALTAGFVCAISVANLAVGLYPGTGLTLIGEARLSSMSALHVAPIFLIVWLLQSRPTLPLGLVIATTCSLLLTTLPLTRVLVRVAVGRCRWWSQRALVVGDSEAASRVYSFLNHHWRMGLRPVGVVADWPSDIGPPSADILRRDYTADWLVVAMPRHPREEVRAMVRALASQNRPRMIVSHVDGSSSLWNRAHRCLDWPGTRQRLGPPPVLQVFKRTIDLALTIVGGLLLLPLMLVIAGLIRIGSPGPAVYRQERIGRRGRRIVVWKFRTMICDGDRMLADYLSACPERLEQWNRDHKLADDPRITPIGRWLRKTSLDELPQLWNVLRGEMSLVGPRPILASEIADFGSSFESFCSVLPGMTGLWQVSGRNQTTYAEHIELDDYYARHWSLWLDIYILVLTIKVVLFRDGAY
jgi:Undecaprenyl-phosphate galactose phosphotransferase WbaP